MLSPTQESVGGTSSYGTPEDLFTQEFSSKIKFYERPPPRHDALCTVVAADAASRHLSEATLLMKQTILVSHSSSVTIAPPPRKGGRQQTQKKQKWPDRTSAAFAWSVPPAPCATAPAPRQDGLAEVATRESVAVAPTRRRHSTGLFARRTPGK